jgi:hypothetical protein
LPQHAKAHASLASFTLYYIDTHIYSNKVYTPVSSSLPAPIKYSDEHTTLFRQAVDKGLHSVSSPYASPATNIETLLDVWVSFQQEYPDTFQHWADEFVAYIPAHWTVGQVNQTLSQAGQHLGMEYPQGWSIAQLIAYAPTAHNAGWSRPLRQNLLGLHWLDATGTVIGAGGRVLKNVTGYDLHRFQLGFQGTLGLPIGVCLRTLPLSSFPPRTFKHTGSVEAFNALYQQLRQYPPDALHRLYRDTSGCYVVWQGSDALCSICLPLTCFEEVTEAFSTQPVVPTHLTLLTVRGVEVQAFQDEWDVACSRFPMLEWTWNLAASEIHLSRRTDAPLDNETLQALTQWSRSLLNAFPALIMQWWNIPFGLEDHARACWMSQLSPLLWRQWRDIRQSWGIAPHQFTSPYVSEMILVEQGVLSQRVEGGPHG